MAAAPRDVRASGFRYFARDAPPEVLQGEVRVFGEAKGVSREEFKRLRQSVTEPHVVPIYDARAAEGGLDSWNLDTNGFCVFPSPQPFPDWRNPQSVMEDYYPKLIEKAKQITGAEHGIQLTMSGAYLIRTENPVSLTESYSAFAHTDTGPESVPGWRKLCKKRGVPEEVADTCDLCMYNVWHPFDRPSYKNTLCLLDASNLDGSRAVETVRYKYETNTDIKDVTGRQMYSKGLTKSQATSLGPLYGPTHRWVYIPDQKPEEAWLFKQYDTREGVCRNTFHNSFYDPFHEKQPNETHGRRSVEFRFILAFPKKIAAAASKL